MGLVLLFTRYILFLNHMCCLIKSLNKNPSPDLVCGDDAGINLYLHHEMAKPVEWPEVERWTYIIDAKNVTMILSVRRLKPA